MLKRVLPIFLLLYQFGTICAQLTQMKFDHLTENFMQFKNLTTDMGLSHGDVLCFCQDHDGYMWIGTSDGLNKYNGIDFTIYKNIKKDTTSLNSSYIYCVYEDKQNNLWIGVLNGLCRYNREKNYFERISFKDDNNNKFKNSVTAIFEDNANKLWIGTTYGLFWFDKENKIFHTCFTDIYGKEVLTYYNEIHQDKNGILWFVSKDILDGGIIRYDPITKETDRYNTQHPVFKLKENAVNSLIFDKQDNIWTGSYSTGLSMINEHTKTITNYQKDINNSNSLSNNFIATIEQNRDGKIFIGTNGGGLNIFDPITKMFNHYAATESGGSLLSNNITKIYIGHDGTIWIACWGGGVSIYDKRFDRFALYKHNIQNENSIGSSSVTCFTEDLNRNIWVATDGGGISLFNPSKRNFIRYRSNSKNPQTLTNDKVLAIQSDNKDGLWVGMWQGGLNYFKIEGEKLILKKKYDFVDENDLISNCIFNIYLNKDNELWIGNYSSGAYKFDPKSEKFKSIKIPVGSSINTLRDIFCDSYKDVWFATEYNGLIRLNRESGEFERLIIDEEDRSGLINSSINVVFEDSKKRLWVGMDEGGLNLFNRRTKSFTHYTTDQGLPDNTIVGILEDDYGNLWISSHFGISKATIDSTNSTGGKLKLTFRNYTVQDGLQGKVFNRWAFLKSRTGEMYFGGLNGFNTFHPDSIKDNSFLPQVHITDFLLFNKPVIIGAKGSPLNEHISQTQELVLNYNQSVFTFRFVALNYIFSEKNQYAYILEGFDKDWNYVGNKREATYTNLDPGKYRFRVKGSNNDGVWNEKGVSVKIIITPPFWHTIWFQLLMFIVLIGSLLTGYKIRTATIRQRTRELEGHIRERTAQLEATNQELEAFTYSVSHDLRTPLRSMDGFSQVLLEDCSDKFDENHKDYLRRIRRASQHMSHLIDDLLKLSRMTRSEMNFEKVDLSKLAESVTEEFRQRDPERKVAFVIAKNVFVNGDMALLKVMLRNLIDNAWKFTSKRKDARIEFGTVQDQDKPVFFIRDDGIGLDMNYADKLFEAFQRQHTEFEGTGIGLTTVQRIVHRHGGRIWAEGKINEGSTFYFTILKKQVEN